MQLADAPIRVLLVDDDAGLAALVVEALHGDGFDVVHVTTHAAACAEVLNATWDVCVLDLVGGSLTSLDAEDSQAIRTLAQYVPVVLTSGRPWVAHVEAEQLGVRAVLPKPFDLDVLVDTLRTHGGCKMSTPEGAQASRASVLQQEEV